MITLKQYVNALRSKYEQAAMEFPDFDPMDGACQACILFLLEKPGPMTSATGGKGSGFISRNNDDPTAEATFDFMRKAGIPRAQTLLWNVIPGWNGTIKVTSREVRDGVEDLRGLMTLLPDLKAVVLVGRRAARASKLLSGFGLPAFTSAHPSPIVRATNPTLWNEIPKQWAQAWSAVEGTRQQLLRRT